MKFRWEKKYLYWGLTAFLVIVCSISFFLLLNRFNEVMETAFQETAPHRICQYIYGLSDAFNSFYHDTKIMAEEDESVQKSYIRVLELTKSVLEICIDVLGFAAPERM